MSDEATLNINFNSGDSPSGDPFNPLEGTKPISGNDIFYSFPPLDGFKDLIDQLSTFGAEDLKDFKDQLNSFDLPDFSALETIPEFITNVIGGMEQDFKHLETNLQEFNSAIVGFLPEDFESKLDSFFQAIQEDTDAFFAHRQALDDLYEQQNEQLQSLLSEIDDFIGGITRWAGAIGRGIAVFSSFIVGTMLYSAALKEVLNSLGQFSGSLKQSQAEVNRDLTLQALENSERLGDQLATNESLRGDLAMELEQFKTEMFDLLDPFVRFLTITLSAILKVINLVLGVLNVIKDIIVYPLTLIGSLVNLVTPVSENAKDDMRRKRKENLNKAAPGLGDAWNLFQPENFGLKDTDLPPGMYDDATNHPFPDELDPREEMGGGRTATWWEWFFGTANGGASRGW